MARTLAYSICWEQWQVEARLVLITGDMTADKVRNGSRMCENADAETFRATIESGRHRGRIIVAAKVNLMIQYFVSVSKK